MFIRLRIHPLEYDRFGANPEDKLHIVLRVDDIVKITDAYATRRDKYPNIPCAWVHVKNTGAGLFDSKVIGLRVAEAASEVYDKLPLYSLRG